MKKLLEIMVLGLLLITSSQADDNVEIYLLNQLDDPRGFCIDIRGHKLKAKIDKGLQAHTCYSYQGKISPDQGFDSLGDLNMADNMSKFFGKLSKNDALTKTIVYNLNPRDSEMFASMAANFNDGKIAGKMQYGAAWWFLDQKDGMEKQLNVLSNFGLLSRFVGMVTDSRSFLSFPRHEYFRRILCNVLGDEIQKGELPNNMQLIGTMVENICYKNAVAYFEID